jgi:activating signal cointegrator complex subunit 3
VSLRWLKDRCALITKSGGSLLSGDELTMTLCRVLLSNKAGDEVFNVLLKIASVLIFVSAIIWCSHFADSW